MKTQAGKASIAQYKYYNTITENTTETMDFDHDNQDEIRKTEQLEQRLSKCSYRNEVKHVNAKHKARKTEKLNKKYEVQQKVQQR